MSTEAAEIKTEETKVASVGAPTRVNAGQVQPQPEVQEAEVNKQEGAAAVEQTNTEEKNVEQPEITPQQRAAILKELGFEGEEADIENIKAKLNAKPNTEPTDEQKQAAALAEEKEILDLFIANGGTAEGFVGIKNIMNADVKELSRAETLREYQEAGFSKEEAENLVKERFYQNQLDSLEQGDMETDEEFETRKSQLEKKAKFFSEKLDNRAASAKTQAQELYNNFKEAIADRKLQEQKKVDHAANAEAYLKTLPRSITLELGQLNGQPLAPVQATYNEADVAKVSEILKSPDAIKQFFYNEDGSPNFVNLTDALLARETRNSIAREAVLAGQTRMTEVFQSQFPANTPQAVGLGGSRQNKVGERGKVAAAGQIQRVG